MNKAIFLDRDGTINKEVSYLTDISQIEILSGSVEALKIFKKEGFLNIILTNQSAIARGMLTVKKLEEIHSEFIKLFTNKGKCLIDDIYYSPYHKDGIKEEFKKESRCRKPGTEMIEKSVIKHNINLDRSFVIGDSMADMLMAENAGVKKILVATGYGMETLEQCKRENIKYEYFAENLHDAALYIQNRLKLNI